MGSTENNKKTVGKKGFQPGKSGNPGGRPKTLQEVRDAFRLHTITARDTLVSILENEEKKDSDRIRAAEVLLNRAWGTPEQSVAVSGGLTTATVDTSKLPKEKQDALLDALVGVFAGNETDNTD